jgi:hypothetical protein
MMNDTLLTGQSPQDCSRVRRNETGRILSSTGYPIKTNVS